MESIIYFQIHNWNAREFVTPFRVKIWQKLSFLHLTIFSDDGHLSKSELSLLTDDKLVLKISVHCLQ